MSSCSFIEKLVWSSVGFTAAAYIVISVFAIGLWDGQTWVNMQDFCILLVAAAGWETVSGAILSFQDEGRRIGPGLLLAGIRHFVIAALAWHLKSKIPSGQHFPSGFGDINRDGGTTTHSEARETMRMTVIIAACVMDLFIALSGAGETYVSYITVMPTEYDKVPLTTESQLSRPPTLRRGRANV